LFQERLLSSFHLSRSSLTSTCNHSHLTDEETETEKKGIRYTGLEPKSLHLCPCKMAPGT
jgi:hypothetical protein